MKLLDASWTALKEIVQADDRALCEELLNEIIAVELRKRQKQLEDQHARRYNARPGPPWIPEQHIRF